ncbi:hypothetical protein [Phenylobacterium aquaticum]|uniref:DUF6968 family protein n=1 Tax=Phenylobacterium aquaticum TaxID=1763816 RepID=UPI0026EA39C6|nr:hypothetical protein [Phenylobacterium aquaticum]
MALIAELEFDLSSSDKKMSLRIFQPMRNPDLEAWTCAFEIDDPLGVRREIHGESSFQALILSLKTASAYLYGSELYKSGQIGIYGNFGGNLILPATELFLEAAPYPF